VRGLVAIRKLRETTFSSITRQEIAFFDEERNATGVLTTRLAEDAGRIRQMIIGVLE
jgi:hypothetical protein